MWKSKEKQGNNLKIQFSYLREEQQGDQSGRG